MQAKLGDMAALWPSGSHFQNNTGLLADCRFTSCHARRISVGSFETAKGPHRGFAGRLLNCKALRWCAAPRGKQLARPGPTEIHAQRPQRFLAEWSADA